MTALTVYFTETASASTLTTADVLLANVTTGGALSNKNTNLTSGTTGWIEIWSQGNASAQTGAGSQPAPSGHGWLLDSTLIETNHFSAGTWTFSQPFETTVTGTFVADIHYRFYQRSSGGVYTLIGEAVDSAQTIISTAFTGITASISASASATFATGDKLYIDCTMNITTNATTGNMRMQATSSATNGSTSAQGVTPGYVSTTLADKKFTTRLYQFVVGQKKFVSRFYQFATADKKFTTRLKQFAIAQKKFTTRFNQYAVAQKKFTTRFNQFDYHKKFTTRLRQYAIADKKFTTRLKLVGQGQHTYATRFGQYDSQSTTQMLYDDLQQQYARLRVASTNASIELLALVYYVPTQILSEHALPGELDVLLIGETITTDLHVLKTVKDVSDFITAHP